MGRASRLDMHEKIDREKHPLRRRAELRISYGCARTEKNKTQKSLDEVDVVRDGSGDQRQIYILLVRSVLSRT